MSFQDLQCLVWNGEAACTECGASMDSENTSIEAFERRGALLCTECFEIECENEWDEDDGEGEE